MITIPEPPLPDVELYCKLPPPPTTNANTVLEV